MTGCRFCAVSSSSKNVGSGLVGVFDGYVVSQTMAAHELDALCICFPPHDVPCEDIEGQSWFMVAGGRDIKLQKKRYQVGNRTYNRLTLQ